MIGRDHSLITKAEARSQIEAAGQLCLALCWNTNPSA